MTIRTFARRYLAALIALLTAAGAADAAIRIDTK
jgi:hypothetical protein